MDAYVSKPVRTSELFESIERRPRLEPTTDKLLTSANYDYRRFDFLLAINGEDSYGGAMTVSHGRFGGFLLHRSALQRRISTGFTSGLAEARAQLPTNHSGLR
jgi:hypothetical protein